MTQIKPVISWSRNVSACIRNVKRWVKAHSESRVPVMWQKVSRLLHKSRISAAFSLLCQPFHQYFKALTAGQLQNRRLLHNITFHRRPRGLQYSRLFHERLKVTSYLFSEKNAILLPADLQCLFIASLFQSAVLYVWSNVSKPSRKSLHLRGTCITQQ